MFGCSFTFDAEQLLRPLGTGSFLPLLAIIKDNP